MRCIKYRITTEAPILIADTKGGDNYVTTLDFIPGSTILGMFANRLIAKKSLNKSAHTSVEFNKFFLQDNIHFTNAYIISKNDRNETLNNFPLPLSVQHDKDDNKKAYDLLFYERKESDANIQTKPFTNAQGRIDHDKVFYHPVKKSLNFHHERDYGTGSTKKGLIFNYESINEKQIFEGYVLGEENDIEYFRKEFDDHFEARIGRSRHVQYGKVKFEFVNGINEFDSEIPHHTIDDMSIITLTFLSDVILSNQYGFSTTDESVLLKYLQNKISNAVQFEENKFFTKDNTIENYVSVWKLKRPSEISFQAGSCFMMKGISNIDKDKLMNLQKVGIGERRSEGFGRIVFNYQKENIYSSTKINDNDNIIAKPAQPIPQTAKDKMKLIVQDIIIKEIRKNALIDEQLIKDKEQLVQSKSLISKLESFVKGSASKNDFNTCLSQLRKPAMENLAKSRIENSNLYDWLMNKNNIVAMDIINNSHLVKIKEILADISYEVKQDLEFNNKLYKEYFLTFFAALRKSLNKIGG